MLVDDGVFEALAELDAEPPAPTVEQISSEDLYKAIATLEDLLEDRDAHGVEP